MNVRRGLGLCRVLDFWGNLLQSNGTFVVSEGILEEDAWWSRSKTHHAAGARVNCKEKKFAQAGRNGRSVKVLILCCADVGVSYGFGHLKAMDR